MFQRRINPRSDDGVRSRRLRVPPDIKIDEDVVGADADDDDERNNVEIAKEGHSKDDVIDEVGDRHGEDNGKGAHGRNEKRLRVDPHDDEDDEKR